MLLSVYRASGKSEAGRTRCHKRITSLTRARSGARVPAQPAKQRILIHILGELQRVLCKTICHIGPKSGWRHVHVVWLGDLAVVCVDDHL